MPALSIIIVSYNTHDLLRQCLSAVWDATEGIESEVVVVDNGSSDGTLEYLAGLRDRITVISNANNVGFAAANNQGMEIAGGSTLLLLNSDAFISREVVEGAIGTMSENPRIGILGVRIDNLDGSFQAGSGHFPSLWDDISLSLGLDQLTERTEPRSDIPGPVDWIHGACMFVRRTTYEAIGGLDTGFFMYSEEVEWCFRAWKAAWPVWYLPQYRVVHVGGGSSKGNDIGRRVALYRSRLRFRRQLGGRLSSALLWCTIVVGLGARAGIRTLMELMTDRQIGRQSARSDWQLLRALASGSS